MEEGGGRDRKKGVDVDKRRRERGEERRGGEKRGGKERRVHVSDVFRSRIAVH